MDLGTASLKTWDLISELRPFQGRWRSLAITDGTPGPISTIKDSWRRSGSRLTPPSVFLEKVAKDLHFSWQNSKKILSPGMFFTIWLISELISLTESKNLLGFLLSRSRKLKAAQKLKSRKWFSFNKQDDAKVTVLRKCQNSVFAALYKG